MKKKISWNKNKENKEEDNDEHKVPACTRSKWSYSTCE